MKQRQVKPGILLLLFPVLFGLGLAVFFFTGAMDHTLLQLGANRLETTGWQQAQRSLEGSLHQPARQYAYYLVRDGQTPQQLSDNFGVPLALLQQLNPGSLAAGQVIKIPPVSQPLVDIPSTPQLESLAKVTDTNGVVEVRVKYSQSQVVLDLPELARLLAPQGAIEQVGPRHWRINRSILLRENIRLNLTKNTLDLVELRSSDKVVCLCLEDAQMLIKDITLKSFDPRTGSVDINAMDMRSYVRARGSSRMDVIASDISYLGHAVDENNDVSFTSGGTYGMSWRIPDKTLGIDVVTGWVEGNTISHNYFGAYTFGASGMVWRGNKFLNNDKYGLDPHDDSNNALIENNLFANNGWHGMIISKRCLNNIIQNNTSLDNKGHGFMIHANSNHNLLSGNRAERNTDNYVVFESSDNVFSGNIGRQPRQSNLRVNQNSQQVYALGNHFEGGQKGIYIYDNTKTVYLKDNQILGVDQVLVTRGAKEVLMVNSTVDHVNISYLPQDRLVIGRINVR